MASFQGADVSNQTGIKVSANLANVWQDAVSPQSKVRMIKVSIVNEALEEDGIFQRSGSFDDDFKLVHDNMKENVPAYYAYRMDSKNAFASREWVFLCFVPDTAPVRQKMIYAATRATLTKELGDSHFTDNIYGTSMNDFTLEGYKRHRASLSAPKPLTDRERQLAEIRENEKVLIESMKGASQRKAHAPGMNFPLTDEAVEALKKLVISVAAPPEPATMIVKKKVIRRVTVPKKKTAKALSSPASTPLPASPVVSRTNTSTEEDAEKKKEDKEEKDEEETNVKEDEWDDDEEAEAKSPVKKEEEEKEAEEPKKTEEEDQATVSAVEEEEEEETEEIEVEEEVEEEVPAPVAEPKKVERTINFVKLAIDQQNERIELVGESMIQAKELVKNIDEDAPRFTFFAYEHTHQGKEHDSLVFMYTCPGKSKIRERMLYSSCRAGVLEAAKSEAGLEVDKKLETTDVSDLTESFVREELHSHYETASSPSSLRSGSSSSNNSPRVGGMGFGGIPLPAATSTLGNGGRTFNKPVRPGARKVM